MNKVIQADLYRYGGLSNNIIGYLRGFRHPGFRFTYLYRKLKVCNKFSPLRLFYYLLLRRYSFKYGFQIPLSAQIGSGLFMPHFGGIIINSRTVIGKNCDISPNVVIGHELRGKRAGAPTIGDMVWIGPGAVIVGEINIGSNVLIAGNAFVNKNIPSDSIVIGNPAKIFRKKDAARAYINHILRN